MPTRAPAGEKGSLKGVGSLCVSQGGGWVTWTDTAGSRGKEVLDFQRRLSVLTGLTGKKPKDQS